MVVGLKQEMRQNLSDWVRPKFSAGLQRTDSNGTRQGHRPSSVQRTRVHLA
jgi:hypothetical protein